MIGRIGWVGMLAFFFLLPLAGACGKGDADSVGEAALPPEGPLEPGQPLPDVPLVDLEGNPVQTAALLDGHDAILLFISLGCEACEELVDSWRGRLGEFPPEFRVLAVADDEPLYAKQFVEKHDFPFPLYCDEKGVFTHRYKVTISPTVVGVPSDGKIAYVGKAVTPKFTPPEAVELLLRTKAAREKEGS